MTATRTLVDPRLALRLALCAAAFALVSGLMIPQWIPLRVFEENGPVERSTLWVYLLAICGVIATRWRKAPAIDAIAIAVLLLAAAAREADLHIALYGTSILKSRFYLHAPMHQVLGALAILVPVVASALWLIRRHAAQWLRRPARWSAPATTLAVMAGTMMFAKLLDRTPDWLGQARETLPDAALFAMLSMEELLELALPMFVMLATAQCWWLGREEG